MTGLGKIKKNKLDLSQFFQDGGDFFLWINFADAQHLFCTVEKSPRIIVSDAKNNNINDIEQ